jgi:hypothetical protein
LGVSQKLVSNWESGQRPIPEWVNNELKKDGIERGSVSEKYSWPSILFRELRQHAAKQARKVTVRAVISPSSANPKGFADFAAEIKFDGLVLNGQTLYADHIRSAGSTDNGQTVNLVLGGSDLISDSMYKGKEIVMKQGGKARSGAA